jgi:EEF1A lysine methyltransferase 4
MDLLPKDHK